MASPTKITTHVVDALADMPSVFREPAKMKAVLSVWANRYQGLENVAWDLLTKRHLSGSSGVQVDKLLAIIDLARKYGESDAAYKARQPTHIRVLQSSGTVEDLYAIVYGLTAASAIWIEECFPACMLIHFGTTATYNESRLLWAVRKAKDAGVLVHTIYHDPAAGAAFEFDDSGTGGGFGTVTDPAIGGGWATVLQAP